MGLRSNLEKELKVHACVWTSHDSHAFHWKRRKLHISHRERRVPVHDKTQYAFLTSKNSLKVEPQWGQGKSSIEKAGCSTLWSHSMCFTRSRLEKKKFSHKVHLLVTVTPCWDPMWSSKWFEDEKRLLHKLQTWRDSAALSIVENRLSFSWLLSTSWLVSGRSLVEVWSWAWWLAKCIVNSLRDRKFILQTAQKFS